MKRLAKAGFITAILALGGLGLSACSSNEVPPPCPNFYILADAAELTRFQPGAGRDIIDALHTEEMSEFRHGCEHDFDDDGSGELIIHIAPSITSERGPANTSGIAEFEYFVAVVDSDKKRLMRDVFPVSITYTPNVPKVLWSSPDVISYTVNLKPGQTGADFTVYLGLMLTRDELEYQRSLK